MLEALLGIAILVLDIWAIVKIIGSSSSTASKVIWVLVVIFFPILGLIAWFVAGPKGGGAVHA
jgi:hypothetical protein